MEERKGMVCDHCEKIIPKGEQALVCRRNGSIYCSYRCLVIGGFYGHYSTKLVDDAAIEEQIEENKERADFIIYMKKRNEEISEKVEKDRLEKERLEKEEEEKRNRRYAKEERFRLC